MISVRPAFLLALASSTILLAQDPGAPKSPVSAGKSDSAGNPFDTLPTLNPERWATAIRPELGSYPGIAHMAGISGRLVMAAKIDSTGKALDTRLLSGRPQLAAYLDRYIRGIQFKLVESDGQGPWNFVVNAEFELRAKIGIAPLGVKPELIKVAVGRLPL